MLNLQSHFSHALAAHKDWLHFAAHSHHLWPDVTRAAHLQAWDDAAHLSDHKWQKIFQEILPEAQTHIAHQLNLPDPTSLAFAPNTHSLLLRLLSCLPDFSLSGRPARILTTDSEFHSAERQFRRLEEDNLLHVTRIPTEPFATFPTRFAQAATQPAPSQQQWDMVFFSHVFFNSGYAIENLAQIVTAVPTPQTLIVIDGYHGFMALPTDLSTLAHRIFYLAGGYKYAMSGEGCCFLHVPPHPFRPRDTGWYASFGTLESTQKTIAYALLSYGMGGAAFLGATFDPSGLYRFNAVQHWLQSEHLTVEKIHTHIHTLQTHFLSGLGEPFRSRLITPPSRGHFLSFDLPDASTLHQKLEAARILTDIRGTRLRFGFGLYHTKKDIEMLLTRLQALGN